MSNVFPNEARSERRRAFFYPLHVGPHAVRFPYTTSLARALQEHFWVINESVDTATLPEDLRRFARSAEVLFLNWPESLTRRQAVKSLIGLTRAKLAGRVLVWTHHNAEPHAGRTMWSRLWNWWLMRFVDHIVIHTGESRALLKVGADDRRVIEFFHPLFQRNISLPAPEAEKRYDVLLWGAMREGKGVMDFLEYLKNAGELPRLKIKVVGKFRRAEDFATLRNRYGTLGVEAEDRFVSETELDELHRQARFVVFAYNGSSVLNSGALMMSLPRGTPILGPDIGAFREAASRGLIRTFRNYAEAVALIGHRSGGIYPQEQIQKFAETHTWENFAALLHARIGPAGKKPMGAGAEQS